MALSKSKQNIDGLTDVIQAAELKSKLIGKMPLACRQEGGLGRPSQILRSLDTQDLVYIHDIRDWSALGGARYCVLRFDGAARCTDVRFVGISASTKDDPPER